MRQNRQEVGGITLPMNRIMPGVILAIALVLPVAAIGLTEPAPASASPAPYKIAYITDLTGPGAAENSSSPAGFDARIAQQNAAGGVNGHKIVPIVIDDQTSPSIITTAVQSAISKGVIGIVSQSPLFFSAAKYPQQAGIPVTGSYSDGPEWGEQPYTNMFASDNGSVDPKDPANTLLSKILQQHGGTVLGAYGYGISPSSARAATSVPFGSVDFTSAALTGKQKGINALVPALDNDSNYALATALKQAGVKLKAVVFATGYQPSVVKSPAWADVQGDYFLSLFRPWALPNAGTKQMQAAMEK